MAITPLDIQKMRFAQKMRGYDTTEVTNFLHARGRGAADQARRERAPAAAGARSCRAPEEVRARQHELQDALLRSQKVADEILANARREAELMVKEAELTADRIVTQAIEQATHFESRMSELRMARRELQLKFKNTLDLFGRILEADMEEEQRTATVHTLPRQRRK